MIDFGTVRPGTTLYVPFHTFDSNDPSASVTLTGLAVTDVEIYKDGSVTQRASDAGYALLDTDGIDFDGITGIHGFSIDLADNTTAGFFEAGSQYWVVVSSVTVDAATINFIAATFRVGYPDAILNTTIATLASQTSFTLEEGSANDNAYNGCVVCVHDVASAVQVAFGAVSDYTGSTLTVTLAADPAIFTMAAGDNISIFPPANTKWLGTTVQTANDVGADVDAILVDTAEIGTAGAGLTNINLPDQTMNITGDITGNLSGSVGSVTGAVGSVTGAVGSVTGNVGGNVVGSVASVTGAVGSVTGAVGSVTGAVGSVAGNVDGNVTGSVGSLATQAKADVNAEMVDVLNVDTFAEPTGVPAATNTVTGKLGYVFMMMRNKVTITSTKKTFFGDDDAAEFEKDVSDDGTTYTETEVNAI